MAEKYYQSIGRRKTAIAQVRVVPGGKGSIIVNGKDYKEYFPIFMLQDAIERPLRETGKLDSVDITVRAIGGGKTGQAYAVMMGIARALVKYDDSLKTVMRTHGFLTRDARKKERKKFGLHGARRSKQWRKR